MRYLWIASGFLTLCFAVIGIFLPLWPTVPFLLLSAFCFARGSARLHAWLITHPRFGPPINNWMERGAIGISSKIFATVSLIATLSVSIALDLSSTILAIQAVILGAVAIFIWSRPSA
ncbi:MAG: YbaN family protein [Dinoroseobacter sp.]|nr:YbaN family protein [Dinoroseobacter sp.]